MRKRILSLFLALCLLSAVLVTPVHAAFSDVAEDTWYTEAVDYVYMNGLFKGTGDDAFSPDVVMSRGMFVTVLYRMARLMETDFTHCGFPDVIPDMWYTVATNWAVEVGLVNGTDQGTFCPDDPVTREQICKLVSLYCDYMGFTLPADIEPGTFSDASDIHYYAQEHVDTCLRAGLIQGCGDGTLNPTGEASRAEVATILYRLSLLMEEDGYVIGPGNPTADWRMILVNRWNYVPEGYVDSLELTTISGTSYQVDARIYADYKKLVAACNADYLYPYVYSAFRTNAYQATLYNNKINQYMGYGYSRENAELLAQQWVAVPGTSEHELGLALDINGTGVHAWLAENAHYYGFIYRYQADKTEITGIQPEAWHYRYVGVDNAIRITESGLCMEEYIERFS